MIVLEGSLAGKIKEKEVKLGRGNYLEDEVRSNQGMMGIFEVGGRVSGLMLWWDVMIYV